MCVCVCVWVPVYVVHVFERAQTCLSAHVSDWCSPCAVCDLSRSCQEWVHTVLMRQHPSSVIFLTSSVSFYTFFFYWHLSFSIFPLCPLTLPCGVFVCPCRISFFFPISFFSVGQVTWQVAHYMLLTEMQQRNIIFSYSALSKSPSNSSSAVTPAHHICIIHM